MHRQLEVVIHPCALGQHCRDWLHSEQSIYSANKYYPGRVTNLASKLSGIRPIFITSACPQWMVRVNFATVNRQIAFISVPWSNRIHCAAFIDIKGMFSIRRFIWDTSRELSRVAFPAWLLARSHQGHTCILRAYQNLKAETHYSRRHTWLGLTENAAKETIIVGKIFPLSSSCSSLIYPASGPPRLRVS